jgi:hypothetical protein
MACTSSSKTTTEHILFAQALHVHHLYVYQISFVQWLIITIKVGQRWRKLYQSGPLEVFQHPICLQMEKDPVSEVLYLIFCIFKH